jgi:hypothetical protein
VCANDDECIALAPLETEVGPFLLVLVFGQRRMSEPDILERDTGIVQWFSQLVEILDDRSEDPDISVLGGCIPFPRLMAL